MMMITIGIRGGYFSYFLSFSLLFYLRYLGLITPTLITVENTYHPKDIITGLHVS
jgi:hypothetical protein